MVIPNERLSVRLPEAAEMIGVSESTLHRLAVKGIVPSVKVGKSRVFRIEALEQWLKERETAPGEAEPGAPEREGR